MSGRRQGLVVVLVGFILSLLVAGCSSNGEPAMRDFSTMPPVRNSGANPGWEYKGPARVTDTVYGFDGAAEGDLMFSGDGLTLYLVLRYTVGSGTKVVFGISGSANIIERTLFFESCPSAYGKEGPLRASGSGTFDAISAAGEGACRSYNSWKPTPPPGEGQWLDGDMTFSFTNLFMVNPSIAPS